MNEWGEKEDTDEQVTPVLLPDSLQIKNMICSNKEMWCVYCMFMDPPCQVRGPSWGRGRRVVHGGSNHKTHV